MTRPRALMVQMALVPTGGGNGVAAWMLQALAGGWDVTLLAWQVDMAGTDRQFGTRLVDLPIAVEQPPLSLRRAVDALPVRASRLKEAILRRRAQQTAPAFDVVLSACNEVDFGRRSIQYVHYPNRHCAPLGASRRWFHWPAAVSVYDLFAETVAPFSDARMTQNLTLANSQWVAAKLRQLHGLDATVLHPPACWVGPELAWAERADAFVCVGRISPEKEIERVVEILRHVQRGRPDVRLHLAGPADHPEYAQRIAALVDAERAWVTWHRDLTRAQLSDLMARQRYGIHGMREEHFGMAIAEMQQAGCIVFAPRGGGQTEIVEPELQYASVADAVERIERVMADQTRQQRLSVAARQRASALAPERFMETIRALAAEVGGQVAP